MKGVVVSLVAGPVQWVPLEDVIFGREKYYTCAKRQCRRQVIPPHIRC